MVVNMKICFDLDNTLCTGRQVINGKSTYTSCQPLAGKKELLKALHKNGNTIIIYTARGMNTYNSNIELIHKHLRQLTENQLAEWGYVYDELFFGKIDADIFIDDKAINSSAIDLLGGILNGIN